jgi:hypothetical protein
MENIKNLQKELKQKIIEVNSLEYDSEDLEFYILNLIERLKKENEKRFKLNMVYSC